MKARAISLVCGSALAFAAQASAQSAADQVARDSKAAEGKTASIAPPIEPDARTGEILQARKAVLDAISPVTDEMLANPNPADWLQWRRTYDDHGFSPLTQINKNNVKNMHSAWAWSLAAGTSEVTPLVHDGVLFVYGAGDHVDALDAKTGDLLWQYSRRLPEGTSLAVTNGIKRNMAIYGDKIYLTTVDSHLLTLDVKTGKVVWDHTFPDSDKFRMTSGPLIVKGKIIQGVATCPSGGCFIAGLDAATGKELWRFNTVAHPGEVGDNSWNGLPLDLRYGASVWSTGSYDPDLNLLYWGTGNTYAWQVLTQGGPNKLKGNNHDGLFTSSTVALNPETGKLVWYYQHLPEDYWDLDFAFERQIATIPIDGKNRKVVLTTGKTVLTDVMDAATGKWLFTLDQGLQNVVKSIDPETGRKTYDPATIPDMTRQRRNLQCPAGYGAKNWPANSFDQSTNMLYITIAEVCGESLPKAWLPTEPYNGGSQETRIARYFPGSDGQIGRVDAIDLATRKTVWSKRQRAPVTSAALATAGGIMFAGDSDRWFKAFDSQSGDILWQTRLNDSINSFPITYSVDGEQYVAVVAGFGGPRIGNLQQLTREIELPRGESAALWVFKVSEGK